MSEYLASIKWKRDGQSFADNKYSRAHLWEFDGGVTVPASASPHLVPPPFSVAASVDPEEAFVASLCSCHMLFFLSIAAKREYLVDSYIDNAVGTLEKDGSGRTRMTKVILRPAVQFSGEPPSLPELETMHHESHELCFIANSVKTDIIVEIVA